MCSCFSCTLTSNLTSLFPLMCKCEVRERFRVKCFASSSQRNKRGKIYGKSHNKNSVVKVKWRGKCCIMIDYVSLAIIAKYRTLKRKPPLLDPSTSGAKVHTSTAGGGSESVSFLRKRSENSPRSFIQTAYHHVQTDILYVPELFLLRPGLFMVSLNFCEPCTVRSASAHRSLKDCTAELSRTGPGVNPESAGLPAKQSIQMLFGSLWAHQQRCLF